MEQRAYKLPPGPVPYEKAELDMIAARLIEAHMRIEDREQFLNTREPPYGYSVEGGILPHIGDLVHLLVFEFPMPAGAESNKSGVLEIHISTARADALVGRTTP